LSWTPIVVVGQGARVAKAARRSRSWAIVARHKLQECADRSILEVRNDLDFMEWNFGDVGHAFSSYLFVLN
jgi:hypothetical protein